MTEYWPSRATKTSDGKQAVKVSTRSMLFHGFIESVNGAVLVLSNPRNVTPITIPTAAIKRVAPLPAGTKL